MSHRRRTQLPVSVVLPVLAALLSTVPAVSHEDVQVRRLAFAIALILIGVAAISVVIWVHSRVGHTERKVDAWGGLATYLRGARSAMAPEPVSLEQVRRRQRCALLRATDTVVEHAGVATGIAAVGALVAVALAGGGGDLTLSGPAGGPTHDAGPSTQPPAPGLDPGPTTGKPAAEPPITPAPVTVTVTVTPPPAEPVAVHYEPEPSSPAEARSATSEPTEPEAAPVVTTSSTPSSPPPQPCAVETDAIEVGCRQPLIAAGAGDG